MSVGSEISADIRTQLPPPQENGRTLEESFNGRAFSCFGFSLQGQMHKQLTPSVPCQDYNDFRVVEGKNVLIAAVADGVGSCPLSHWGAYVAVREALDSIEKSIQMFTGRGTIQLKNHEDKLKDALNNAFSAAMDSVEDLATIQRCPPRALQSTLTLVVYDGESLYCEHAGDDGVVVQFMDGSVVMLTQREKGEEANSVLPLQSRRWSLSKAGQSSRGAVVGFLMATDGLLDSFVADNPPEAIGEAFLQKWNSCMNGIDYRFMKPTIYDRNGAPRDADKCMKMYINAVNKGDFRRAITDDLTLVSVINSVALPYAKVPVFDPDKYDSLRTEMNRWQNARLYGRKQSTEEAPLHDTRKSASKEVPRHYTDYSEKDNHEDAAPFTPPSPVLKRNPAGSPVKENEKHHSDRWKLQYRNRLIIIVTLSVLLFCAIIFGAVKILHANREPENVQTEAATEAAEGAAEAETGQNPAESDHPETVPDDGAPQSIAAAQGQDIEDRGSIAPSPPAGEDPVASTPDPGENPKYTRGLPIIKEGEEEPLRVPGFVIENCYYILYKEFCIAYYNINESEYENSGFPHAPIYDGEVVDADRYYPLEDIAELLHIRIEKRENAVILLSSNPEPSE